MGRSRDVDELDLLYFCQDPLPLFCYDVWNQRFSLNEMLIRVLMLTPHPAAWFTLVIGPLIATEAGV